MILNIIKELQDTSGNVLYPDVSSVYDSIELSVFVVTARQSLAGCGLQDSGLSFGGINGNYYLPNTEKFNKSTILINNRKD